jgi:hypothetical protein
MSKRNDTQAAKDANEDPRGFTGLSFLPDRG